jgi:hypothetical protein
MFLIISNFMLIVGHMYYSISHTHAWVCVFRPVKILDIPLKHNFT